MSGQVFDKKKHIEIFTSTFFVFLQREYYTIAEIAVFDFKRFRIDDSICAMKVGTDGVLLGAWTDLGDVSSVVDVGCGSGLISLMIAQRLGDIDYRVTGIDIDRTSVDAASVNICNSPWRGVVDVKCMDFADYDCNRDVDLIVSNPPFFSTGERSPRNSRSMARHKGALSPESLISYASAHLSPRGSVSLIAPAEDEDELVFLAEMAALHPRRISRVVSVAGRSPYRVMLQAWRTDGALTVDTIVIRESDGATYTPQYRMLTKDFYLNF